jgi:ribosomal protein S18 acetylase RimI-like enzyme
MSDPKIRPAVSTDIKTLAALDHGYSTDHVWQMGFQEAGGSISVQFKEVRLPRPMRVRYPRNPKGLSDTWTELAALLVAEVEAKLVGYLGLVPGPAPGSAWVTDLAVDLVSRRHGHATALVSAARQWALASGFRNLYMEMQSKNYPCIRLARKLGFAFAGYSDHYYPDGDIALFFILPLT